MSCGRSGRSRSSSPRVLYCSIVKIYVVNLERAPDRLTHMAAQLQRLGLDYEVVAAVDGAELTPTDRRGLVDESAVSAMPQWLTAGAVGCALSHRLVYERMLSDGHQIALVLEDDVRLEPSVVGLLAAVEEALRGAEVALLNYRSRRVCHFDGRTGKVLAPQYRLLSPQEAAHIGSTAAYVVTRAAAARIHAGVVPVRAAADSWGMFVAEGFVDRVWCVFPRPVDTDTSFSSTIDYVPENSPTARLKAVARRRGAQPLKLALSAARAVRERRMSRFVVDE